MARRQDMPDVMYPEAQRILDKAKERGVESNFLFSTTFERYLTQLKMLDEIKSQMHSGDDEYVRMMRLYNSTVSGANGTAGTLVTIIKKLGSEAPQENKLKDFIDAFRDDDED